MSSFGSFRHKTRYFRLGPQELFIVNRKKEPASIYDSPPPSRRFALAYLGAWFVFTLVGFGIAMSLLYDKSVDLGSVLKFGFPLAVAVTAIGAGAFRRNTRKSEAAAPRST